MPVKLLNNYPENNLEKNITNKDGSPLFGEIWLYKQFLKLMNIKIQVQNQRKYKGEKIANLKIKSQKLSSLF